MELDILINYSEKNSTEKVDSKAWANHFTKFLGVMLNQILGKTPNIALRSESSSLSTTELENTGLMICLMAPEFVASSQCLDALKEFDAIVSKQGSEYPRIFNVVKSYVPTTSQPLQVQGLLPYVFYDDQSQGDKKEFTDYFGPNAENIYWMKMVDLVYDLLNSLLAVQEDVLKADDIKPLYERQTVYLAETTSDLSIQRNIIKRELQRHGFQVLPDRALPANLDELQDYIRDAVKNSLLSIHLVGNNYGETVEGGERSVVDIQNRVAAEVSSDESGNHTPRLIWINPNQDASDDTQRNFVENIQRDLNSLDNAEILQTPLEDFKNTIRLELFQSDDSVASVGEAFIIDDNKLNAYFIYDQIDEAEAIPVKKELIKAGLNVLTPEIGDNLMASRNSHLEKLKYFDLGIIFRGKVNDNWTRIKLLDMLKAPGLGRQKPILGKAIVVGSGVEVDKTNFEGLDVEYLGVDKKEPIGDQIDSLIKNLAVSI